MNILDFSQVHHIVDVVGVDRQYVVFLYIGILLPLVYLQAGHHVVCYLSLQNHATPTRREAWNHHLHLAKELCRSSEKARN